MDSASFDVEMSTATEIFAKQVNYWSAYCQFAPNRLAFSDHYAKVTKSGGRGKSSESNLEGMSR